jgi:hypothetical protein
MMHSIMAALRSLTLPYGATSGPRIVLNGVTGRIEVYSDLGNLMITLDDDGIITYDADGDQRLAIAAQGAFSSIVFRDTAGANAGVITYQPILGADHRDMGWQGPNTSEGFGRLFMVSPIGLTKNPMLQFDTGFFSASVAKPLVDLTGFNDARAAQVIVDDIRQGVSQGGGNAPTIGKTFPRGIVDRAVLSVDLVFSTTNNTWSDIVATTVTPVQAGRLYKVTFDGGFRILTAGSGFAVGDAWQFELQVDEGAGFTALNTIPRKKWVASWVAGAASITPPSLIGYHAPAVSGTMAFKCRGTKTQGANTVTSTLGASGGGAASGIVIEDIGEA